MNTNLLDLNTDILNIIGDYVKKDNTCRLKKEEDFESTDYIIGELIYELEEDCITKKKIGMAIYSKLNLFYKSEVEIKEYIYARKTWLKKFFKYII